MRHYLPAIIFVLAIVLYPACKKESANKTDLIDPNDTIENPIDTTTVIDTIIDTTVTLSFCNGHPELCDKKYDELVSVMTHNAHAHTPVFSELAANQANSVTTQLNDGVRALTFKTYYTDDAACGSQDVYVYHGFATLGCTPFIDVLNEVKAFMDANPNEVVTIGLEGSASVSRMKPVFDDAGLTPMLHPQELGQAWPTLGELIESGERLVVFTDRGVSANAAVDGFQDYWSFIVDNDYDAQQLSDFNCEWFRGDPSGGLYLFNHFITKLTPQPDSAQVINQRSVLLTRIRECEAYKGRLPNFLHVDFYNYGDCLSVADELNGVQ